jgi:hypothetical protein
MVVFSERNKLLESLYRAGGDYGLVEDLCDYVVKMDSSASVYWC